MKLTSSLLILFLTSFALGAELKVKISPTGNIDLLTQVKAVFSEDAVALGDDGNSKNTPISSSCFTDGYGYWSDTKTWIYNFKKVPAMGTKCEISTNTQFPFIANKTVEKKSVSFVVATAQVIDTIPSTYSEIADNQIFLISTNSPVNADWIQKNVFFSVKGMGDKISAVLASEKEKAEIFTALKKDRSYFFTNAESDANIAVIKASRPFPREATVFLKWNKSYEYNVEPVFKAKFSCERESADSGCSPLSNMTVSFTQKVDPSLISKIYLLKPNGTRILSAEAKQNSKQHFTSLTFTGPFESQKEMFMVVENIKNIDNEPLTNQDHFPIKVKTADYPTLFKIDRPFSVIESSHPVLPITVRHLDKGMVSKSLASGFPLNGSQGTITNPDVSKILSIIRSLNTTGPTKPANISGLSSVSFKVTPKEKSGSTEVVGIPLKGKGLHFFEFQSRILGKKYNYEPEKDPFYYIRSASLVTNLSVTIKYSDNQILTWVTYLDSGKPVSDAQVSLYSDDAELAKQLRTNKYGLAEANLTKSELAMLRPKGYERFYVFAEKADDYSFVSSTDTDGIEAYRFGLDLPYSDPEIIHHVVLEKTLLKPNEILKGKILFRKLTSVGLIIPKVSLPKKIQIKDILQGKTYNANIKWSMENGSGVFEWTVPKEILLGSYDLNLVDRTSKGEETNVKTIGSFKIEDFKLQAITTQLNTSTDSKYYWVKEANPKVSFKANYFSGAPAAGLPVNFNYSINKGSFDFNEPNLVDFRWLEGEVKTGVSQNSSDESEPKVEDKAQTQKVRLTEGGTSEFEVKNLSKTDYVQRVAVTAEYKDPNGDYQTKTRGFKFYNTNYAIGIKSKTWMTTSKNLDVQVAVFDLNEKAVPNSNVKVKLYKVDNFSSRKKLIGGFYTYDNFEEVKALKEYCDIKTGANGLADCSIQDKSLAGEYIVQAESKDQFGNPIFTHFRTYVYTDEPTWYSGSDSDRMDLIPTKKIQGSSLKTPTYAPGEMAEFQIKSPVQSGQLLVTVERDRVLANYIFDYSSKNPAFKLKISDTWAPNVVITATLIQGRIKTASDLKVGAIDLAKPSFKMGMTPINVSPDRFELKVTSALNKQTFEPRENVTATIKLTDHAGNPLNGEAAVAVIDESLLSIYSNNTWNIFEAFYGSRAHSVKTSYLMSSVLGRRTLGLKAVPAGGDGNGSITARELFETSLYWNPNVIVKNGEAKVNFKTNDSLTSYRFVAIANSGAIRFGRGDAKFNVTKNVQSFSSLPLAARKGDQLDVAYSVLNSTKEDLELSGELNFNGAVQTKITQNIKPGETKFFSWPVQISTNFEKENLVSEFKVSNKAGKILDLMKNSLPIKSVWLPRTVKNVLDQATAIDLPIKKINSEKADVLQITALSQLSTDLPGLKKFWIDYPFNCLEQLISKYIALNDLKSFELLTRKINLYTDGAGLLKFYPDQREGSVYLTNYLLQVLHYKNWALPSDTKNGALDALRRHYNGLLKTSEFTAANQLRSLRIQTLNTLSLYGKANADDFQNLKIGAGDIAGLNNSDLSHILSILAGLPSLATELTSYQNLIEQRSHTSATSTVIKDIPNSGYGYEQSSTGQIKIIHQLLKQRIYKGPEALKLFTTLKEQTESTYLNTMERVWVSLGIKEMAEIAGPAVKGPISWSYDKVSKKANLTKDSISQTFDVTESANLKAAVDDTTKKIWWNILYTTEAPLEKNFYQGISLEKTWTPVTVKNEKTKTVGDVWKIQIKISSESQFKWLAVSDPLIPGSTVISEGSSFSEKKALDYNVFEPWFDQGKMTYEYTIRLNQSGRFKLPATHAEAMYQPALRGDLVNSEFVVEKNE